MAYNIVQWSFLSAHVPIHCCGLKNNLFHLLKAIPKSTNEGRLKANIDLFDFALTSEDKMALGALDANIRVVDFAFFKG